MSTTAPRRRLDAELVARGLAPSREHARSLVLAGRVLVAGAPAAKPDRQVSPAEPIIVQGPPPRFVGRGGHKLEAAIERFAVPIRGLRAVDVGASTGGFTDCLLQHGATEVVAIDVGYGQLHEKLRADPRVRNIERCNVRSVDVDALGGPAPLVVVDVSFISLATVAPALVALLASGGVLVALVKPQFEAGRVEVSKGSGVVRDPLVWRRVLDEARSGLAAAGAVMMGAMVSPIRGASGNVEFLVWAVRAGERGDGAVDDVLLDAVVAEAVALVEQGRGA
jgi:23S rRNA (cytidine1920-2'-O)/16S rRNA (cytidine1409-2'-O)-methyltransferase